MPGLTAGRMPTHRHVGPFVAAIATSIGVGLVLAIGFATPDAPAPDAKQAAPAERPRPCAEAGITAASGRSGTCLANDTLLTVASGAEPLVLDDRRVRVLSTEFVEATTPEGQARERARLELRVSVQNTSSRPLLANDGGTGLWLSVAGQRIDADPNADALPTALRRQRPIAGGQSTEGILRFELAGAPTRAVRESGRADFGVAGPRPDRKGVIRVRVP